MNIGPIVRAMRHNRTRVVLIVLEIGMTLAIVTNCINVILAEREKMSRPSGFDDDNVVWMLERPFTAEFKDPMFLGAIIPKDLRIMAGVPGVRAVGNTSFQLWEGGGSSTQVRPLDQKREPVGTQIYYGTKDMLEAVGARITEGRGFTEEDFRGPDGQPASGRVAVISRALADDLFPGEPALGKSIGEAFSAEDVADDPLRVVGVLETAYNPWGMGGGDQDALGSRVLFRPGGVASYERGIPYQIRTEPGTMTSVISEVEKRLAAANPGRTFEFKRTEEKKDEWFAGNKIVVTTMSCIIVTLVVITALGLLGLTSLSVAERTKQIGTRRALGATRAAILRHFLLENWLLTTAGLILGVFGAYALNFLLVSHVSEVKMDWKLVAGGMVLLWVSGLLSTVPAALRASTVPPSIATRSV
ncbi:MAG TPA: FtsX-like permease family protein [Candidatus Polarisedimenticolaceae bacterium]|nr:FtsX-like permease family protein [Candidatus Polarisedimenticolaceae bacterium]